MAKPKRDYTIEKLSDVVFIHLNDLDGELMVKMLRVKGIVRCQACPAASFFAVVFSPNYDSQELLDELEALLVAHFAPVPGIFEDSFDEALKP